MAEHINGPLHWERLGRSGRPIAFVHFTPADHSSFVYQMDHFSTWFQCIGIDLPGFGKSPTAQPGFTISDLAQACWEAVDETTDEPAVLVGISTGSSVVRFMAHQQPDRTLAIVMSGGGRSYKPLAVHQRIPTYQEHGLEFRYQHILEEYSPAFRESPQGQYFARLFAERNPWADLPTIIELFRALRQPRPDWLDSGLKAPTLIVTGSLDAAHDRALAHQARTPGSELVTIEGRRPRLPHGKAVGMGCPFPQVPGESRPLRRHFRGSDICRGLDKVGLGQAKGCRYSFPVCGLRRVRT